MDNIFADILRALEYIDQVEGLCIVTALNEIHPYEQKMILKRGLKNVVEVTVGGKYRNVWLLSKKYICILVYSFYFNRIVNAPTYWTK